MRMKRDKARRIKRVHVEALDALAIGRRIAEARKRRNWRQADLAAAAGLGKGTIAAIETGLRIPSRDTLLALSAVLRRKLDWITYGRTGDRVCYGERRNPTEGGNRSPASSMFPDIEGSAGLQP